MAANWIEARLYWADDLLAVTYTAARNDLRFEDLGLPAFPDAADVRVHLSIVPREHLPLPRRSRDGRFAFGVLAAIAAHALFGALAFHGRASEAREEEGHRTAMMAYAAAIDARGHEKVDPRPATPDPNGGQASSGESGAAGNPARTNDVGRTKDTRGVVRRASTPDRGGEEVTTFGMLALVAADRPGQNAGSSPWAKDLGPAAMGNMFGATIDDAFGNGGLGLTGNGEGGGGKGQGIAFGGIETSGFGTCGSGCRARVQGTHVVRSLVVRCGDGTIESKCTAQVHGRLPPEAVQRVVRASFGRFRGCYEQGLVRDPGLEGRIAAKFVIARDGSVAMVSTAESSLPDASVTKCVERAFYGLTFPEPEGGIVTVVYPITFSTST